MNKRAELHDAGKGFLIARPSLWVQAIVIAAPAMIYCISLLTGQGYILGWLRTESVSVREGLPLAVSYGAYLLFVYVALLGPTANRVPRWTKWAGILAGSVALQLAATAVVEPYPLRGILFRQLSQVTGGYFSVGARWDNLADVLAHYVEQSKNWPIHPRNHPPGLMMLFWATTQVAVLTQSLSATLAPMFRPLTCFDEGLTVLTDAQVMGGVYGSVLEFAAATVAIVPLWHLTRRLSNERAAWLAAAFYPMTACMLAWVSRWDRSFVYVSIGGIALIDALLIAAQNRAHRRALTLAIALGALFAVGLFMSYKLAPVTLAFGLFALSRAFQLRDRDDLRGFLRSLNTVGAYGLASAVTAAVLWTAFSVLSHFDAAAHFVASVAFHSGMERPYWPWAAYSALDVLNHVGLTLAGVALVWGWRRGYPLAVAFFGTLLVLSVFRITHDETGRLLTWLAPLGIAVAAEAMSAKVWNTERIVSPGRSLIGVSILGLAAVQIFLHVLLLRVISYGVDPLTLTPASPPASMTPVSIRYGQAGELRLVGYELPANLAPGQHANAVLYWRLDGLQPPATSYKIFIHVASTLEDRERIASIDGKPMNWALPTTCWMPGVLLKDPHAFVVDANARPGEWLALLGLYREDTGERAPVFEAQRAFGGAVELPTLLVVR